MTAQHKRTSNVIDLNERINGNQNKQAGRDIHNNYSENYFTKTEVDSIIFEKIKLVIIIFATFLILSTLILILIIMVRQSNELNQLQNIIYQLQYT